MSSTASGSASIADLALHGRPLDFVPIVDSHAHLGHYYNFHVPAGSAEDMLLSMDRLAFNAAFISAHACVGSDFKLGNDEVMQAVREHRGRFVGYVTVNPNYPDEMLPELDRCLSVEGMRGIKLHPSAHGFDIDYKTYRPVYEYADEHGLLVLIHVWGRDDVRRVRNLAGQYHAARFLMGHAGADERAMEDAVGVVNKYDNTFVDLALSVGKEGNVEWLVREMGSRKIFFATDMPFMDPRCNFGRVALADIDDEAKRDMLGRNVIELAHLDDLLEPVS